MSYESNWERSVDRYGKLFMSDCSCIEFDKKNRSNLLSDDIMNMDKINKLQHSETIFNFGNYANHASYGKNNVDYVEKTFLVKDFVFFYESYDDDDNYNISSYEDVIINSNVNNNNVNNNNVNTKKMVKNNITTICLLPYVLHGGVIDDELSIPGVVLVANRDIKAGDELLCCYDDIKYEDERVYF